MGWGRLAVGASVGMLVFPASSGLAATAEVTARVVNYSAAAGETNAVIVTREDATHFRFSDGGASIFPIGPECVSAGADVVCDFSSLPVVWMIVDLGDGHDSADLSAAERLGASGGTGNDEIVGSSLFFSALFGGIGNDHLAGGSSLDNLVGDEGDDVLLLKAGSDRGEGGPGDDSINGGQGRDFLFGDAGDDVLVGASGLDTVFASGINLLLTPTTLSGAGSDTLSGVEAAFLSGGFQRNVINARTWRGRTEIHALGGKDLIVGGFGPDTITGGVGNDRIAGRGGHDVLMGEWGADVLFSRDGRWDRVDGGPGTDRARVDRLDTKRGIEVVLP